MLKIFTFSLIASGLLMQSCSETVEPQTGNDVDIEQLYIAARETDAAIVTGGTYDSYAQKVVAVTAKLLIAQDHGVGDGKRKNLLTKYSLLIDQYRSALDIWRMGMQNAHGDDPRLVAIQQKYLITASYQVTHGDKTLFEDIRDQLWQRTVAAEKEIVPLVRGQIRIASH